MRDRFLLFFTPTLSDLPFVNVLISLRRSFFMALPSLAIFLFAGLESLDAASGFGVERPYSNQNYQAPALLPLEPSPPADSVEALSSSSSARPESSVPTAQTVPAEHAVRRPILQFQQIQQPLAEAERPHPSVARIVAFDAKGQQYGSGTLIEEYGDYGIVITNWHVVESADGLVHVHFPNRFGSYGAVIALDSRWDLAAVAISKPPRSTPKLSLSQTIPRPGHPLWIVGYGAGAYRMAGGRCLRYLAPETTSGQHAEFECIELSVDARLGDSGGPILNENGEIAGVLFGSDQRNTAGSHCGRVRTFMQEVMRQVEMLPQKPEALFASIETEGPKRRLIDSRKPIVMAEKSVEPAHSTGHAVPTVGSFGISSPTRASVMILRQD